MNTINRLKRDHDLLRSKLGVLESALGTGQDAWLVLREVSFTLASQLGEHIKNEEELLIRCRSLIGAEPWPWKRGMFDHHRAREQLMAVKRFFAEQPVCLLELIRPTFLTLMAELRQEMDWQENRLFPRIEDTLILQELTRRNTRCTPPRLAETMTVQEAIIRYPVTAQILEWLFIADRFERYDCLDEVAWRHGMDAQALLALLEQAIGCSGEEHGKGGEDNASAVGRTTRAQYGADGNGAARGGSATHSNGDQGVGGGRSEASSQEGRPAHSG